MPIPSAAEHRRGKERGRLLRRLAHLQMEIAYSNESAAMGIRSGLPWGRVLQRKRRLCAEQRVALRQLDKLEQGAVA